MTGSLRGPPKKLLDSINRRGDQDLKFWGGEDLEDEGPAEFQVLKEIMGYIPGLSAYMRPSPKKVSINVGSKVKTL